MKKLILFLLCTTLSFSATVTYEWGIIQSEYYFGGTTITKSFIQKLGTLEKWQIDMMKPLSLMGYASSGIIYAYPIRAITNK
jgi:hypothetical protein